MLNDFLTKIANAFSADFLFASLLPLLLFLTGLAAALILMLGWDAVRMLHREWWQHNQTVLLCAASILLIVFSYLLSMLRGIFLRFWSGQIRPFKWLIIPGKDWHVKQYQDLTRKSEKEASWLEMETKMDLVSQIPADPERSTIKERELKALVMGMDALHFDSSKVQISTAFQKVLDAYKAYEPAGLNPSVMKRVNKFRSWLAKENLEARQALARRVQTYGSFETIQPTQLGNIVQSYNEYSYWRYQMESEIFWPRLVKVVEEPYLKTLEAPRVMLDFSVTSASLSLLFLLLSLILPWLWSDAAALFFIAGGVLGTVFFYGLALTSANSLGQLIKSCYDLYHLKLLAAFQQNKPADIDEERRQWQAISQLIVYGKEGTKINYSQDVN